jgi:tRNA (guanine-N(7)-)-methyltransferase
MPESPAIEYTFPLDPFQQCAFKAIHEHQHVLVTAKTGSGKTLIGEEQVRVSLAKGKRCFYTTPIKSLSNQKFHDFKKLGHPVGILTGDIKFAPQSPLVVMTTELLCNLLFKKDTPNQLLIDLSLEDVDSIIFDEVHYINDPDRGKVWEQCLMMLPPSINMVMLSATIADADKFGTWLAKTKNAPVHLISTQYRVVPLIHMVGAEVVLDSKDKFHPEAYTKWLQSITDARKKEREHEKKVATRRRGGYDDVVVTKEHRTVSFLQRMNELIDKLDENTLLPALFFVFSRNKCEEYAQKVTSDLLDSSDVASVKHILRFHLHKYKYIETCPQYHKLARLLEKGVAFHHSGLLPVLKEIVEILFSKGFVKVLFATETFAVGINMPTKTVVFTSYQKHDAHGYRMLRSDEYIQMAGRAGRRGKDTEGLVLYLPDREAASLEEVQKMMNGQQQRVSSKMDFGYDFLIKTFYGNAINWKDIYRNPRQPLHIDVGCAKGVCIENLSKRDHRKNWNHLGVEIREDLLKDRIAAVANEMPSNLHYVSCNFATSVSDLLNTLQVGVVRLISFQFPDPWRRERHKKRLILQSSLIDSLARFLTEGALVYISSDCEHVAQKFAAELESSPYFELYNIQSVPATIESQAILHPICSDPETVLQEKDGWLAFNPLAEPSERELVCEMQWKRVWRCIYVRNERRSRS